MHNWVTRQFDLDIDAKLDSSIAGDTERCLNALLKPFSAQNEIIVLDWTNS